jgi:predicted nucleic acid-binding protein
MDPFDGAMRHMQQVADMSERQAVLGKRSSALELARIEGEIVIAKARAAVADAEVFKLRVRVTSESCDEAEVSYIDALIAAATAERDARLAEVEALDSYLAIKQQIAEIALEIDPNAMSSVIALMAGLSGDDPETFNP